MTTKSVQAWLIHKQWSGDTSARVHFFTPELGLVQSLCKGGRTPKKQALLQAFTPLWVTLEERYERYYAQSVESNSSTLLLTGHALFSALYINELIYYALQPQCPEPKLFAAYLFTLTNLTLTNDRLTIEALLRRFEWSLLDACGHSFSLTHDARTSDPINSASYYQFFIGEGLSLAKTGIPGAHLLALAADNLDDAMYLKSAKIIMRKAIDHLLGGREIKARSLYST